MQVRRVAQTQAAGDLALDITRRAAQAGPGRVLCLRLPRGEKDFRHLEVGTEGRAGQSDAIDPWIFDFTQ